MFVWYIVVESKRYESFLFLCTHNSCFFVFAVEDSKRQKRWKQVQPGDLKVFFALHAAMGLVHKPNVKSYWSKDLVTQTLFFGEHMSQNSFKLILQKTHFNK